MCMISQPLVKDVSNLYIYFVKTNWDIILGNNNHDNKNNKMVGSSKKIKHPILFPKTCWTSTEEKKDNSWWILTIFFLVYPSQLDSRLSRLIGMNNTIYLHSTLSTGVKIEVVTNKNWWVSGNIVLFGFHWLSESPQPNEFTALSHLLSISNNF